MARKKLLTEGEIRQFMKLANLRPVAQGRLSEMYDTPGARDEDDELRDELDATEDELGDEDALADEEGAELDDMSMDDGGGMVSMDDFMSALERAIEEVTGEEADVSDEPGDEEVEMDMEVGPEGDEMGMEVEEDPMMEERGRRGHGGGARSDDPEKNKRGKFGGNKGDIPDADRKKKGHYGRGGKTRETAEEEGEEDFNEGMADAKHGDVRKGRMQRKAKRPEDDGPVGDIMSGDDSEVLPGDDSDDAAVRRSRKSRGHRPDRMEEVVSEVAKRVAARLQAQGRQDQVVDQLAERIMKRLTKK